MCKSASRYSRVLFRHIMKWPMWWYCGKRFFILRNFVDSILARVKSWSGKLKDILPFITNRRMPLTSKDRIYSRYVRSVMSHWNRIRPVKEEDVIWLWRNDARMIRWMCSVRPKENDSYEAPRARLKSNSMRECSKYRKLKWKRIFDLINVKSYMIMVISPEDQKKKEIQQAPRQRHTCLKIIHN